MGKNCLSFKRRTQAKDKEFPSEMACKVNVLGKCGARQDQDNHRRVEGLQEGKRWWEWEWLLAMRWQAVLERNRYEVQLVLAYRAKY